MNKNPGNTMTLTKDQTQLLQAPLDPKHVETRPGGGGRELSYIEGWHAIAEANRIFGFDGWSSETVELKMVYESSNLVSYIAKVRITIDGLQREGVGAGHGRGGSVGDKHESAVKEAETDARKRALMTFGNQFGLALYDKTQANVSAPTERNWRAQPKKEPPEEPSMKAIFIEALRRSKNADDLDRVRNQILGRHKEKKITDKERESLMEAFFNRETELIKKP